MALAIFAASRAVIATGLVFGKIFLVPYLTPFPWDAGTAWYYRLLRWDSGWYLNIARNGYHYYSDPTIESTVVFYPLYPLAARAAAWLFGCDVATGLVIVANAAAPAAAMLFASIVAQSLGEETALVAVACFGFFPFSLFLSAGYTEPLTLFFSLLSLLLITRQRFVLAALMAGLAAATRSTGIVLLPVILLEMARQNRQSWQRLVPRLALCALLAASGLLAFMAYLGGAFGNPMAFADGQRAWHHESFANGAWAAVTLATFDGALSDPGHALACALFVIFLVLTLLPARRLPLPVVLYGLGSLLLPYFTLGIYSATDRFVLMCISGFAGMGFLGQGRPWLVLPVVGLFGALLLMVSALYSQWYRIG
jgi:hypothetical protein